MVKVLKPPRTNKSQTLEQVKKVKKVAEPVNYHLEQHIERRYRFKDTKKLRSEVDLNIDLASRIETVHIDAKSDSESTYFGEFLEVKRSAQGSANEKAFFYHVSLVTQSLPIVLHNLGEIVRLCLEYYEKSDKVVHQFLIKALKLVILEALPHLIRDCREEFMPYFYQVLKSLHSQIDIEKVDLLESFFVFLAYAIRYLEKQLVAAFLEFADLFISLFYLHPNKAVRAISSQAVSYLIKKYHKKSLLQQLITLCAEKRQLSSHHIDDGLALTIFRAMQAINLHLNQNTLALLKIVWDKGVLQEQLTDMFQQLIGHIIQNTTYKSADQGSILISLVEVFEFLHSIAAEQPHESMVEAATQMATYHGGSKVSSKIYQILLRIAECSVGQWTPRSLKLVGVLMRLSLDRKESGTFTNQILFEEVLHKVPSAYLKQIIEALNFTPTNEYEDPTLPVLSKEIYQLLLGAAVRVITEEAENADQYEVWNLLWREDAIKLAPKGLVQSLSEDFYKKFEIPKDADTNKYMSMCYLLRMVELPQQNNSRIADIFIKNHKVLWTKIKAEWTTISQQVGQQLQALSLEFKSYAQSLLDTDIIVDDLHYMLSEAIIPEGIDYLQFLVQSASLNALLQMNIFTVGVLLDVGQSVEKVLHIESLGLASVLSPNFRYYFFGQRSPIVQQYSDTILKLLSSGIGHGEQLLQFFEPCLGSKSRLLRLNSIKMALIFNLNDNFYQLLHEIDQEETTLQNERLTKNSIHQLKQHFKEHPIQCDRMLYGLAHMKFQLPRSTIIETLAALYETSSSPFARLIVSQFLLRYPVQENHHSALDLKTVYEGVLVKAFHLGSKNLPQQQKPQLLPFLTRTIRSHQVSVFVQGQFLKVLNQVLHLAEDPQQYLQLMTELLVDEFLQQECLQCILTLELLGNQHKEFLGEFFESLKKISNGDTFRSEITQISLSIPESMKTRMHKYLIYTLYPKLYSKHKLHKKMKGTFRAVEMRRNTVFEFLSQFDDLSVLFELVRERHNLPHIEEFDSTSIDTVTQVRFLRVAANLIDKMGFRMTVIQMRMLAMYALGMYANTSARELHKLANKLLIQICLKFAQPNDQDQSFITEVLEILSKALRMPAYSTAFTKLREDSKVQASGALKLLRTLCSLKTLHPILIEFHELLLGKFFLVYRPVTKEQQMEIEEQEIVDAQEQEFEEVEQEQQEQIEEEDVEKNIVDDEKNTAIVQDAPKKAIKGSSIVEINAILQNILHIEDFRTSTFTIDGVQDQLRELFCTRYGPQALHSMFSYICRRQLDPRDLRVLQTFYCLCVYVNHQGSEVTDVVPWFEYFVMALKDQRTTSPAKQMQGEVVINLIKCIMQLMRGPISIDQERLHTIHQAYSNLFLLTQIPIAQRAASVEVLFLMNKVFSESQLDEEILDSLRLMNVKNSACINDELEYDECLRGCQQFSLQVQRISTQHEIHTANIVMQNLFYLIHTPELSVRLALQDIFQNYFDRALVVQQMSSYVQSPMIGQLASSLKQFDEGILKLTTRLVAMYLQYTKQRKDPSLLYADLAFLDQNIFEDLFDIQLPKRIKALHALDAALQQPNTSSIQDILIPILEYMALDRTCISGRRVTDTNRSHMQTLQKAAVDLIGRLSSMFDWEGKVQFMQDHTTILTKELFVETRNELRIMAVIKLIASVARNLQSQSNIIELIKEAFTKSKETSMLQKGLKQLATTYAVAETEEDEGVQRLRVSMMELEDVPEIERMSFKNLVRQEKEQAALQQEDKLKPQYKDKFWNQICSLSTNETWVAQTRPLLERVYIPLKNIYMMQSKQDQATSFQDRNTQQLQDKLRIQVGAILSELVVSFPPETFMVELNRLVQRVCRLLKSRDNDLRDQARSQLIMISTKVGPTFFHFIIQGLKHALTQGFENHVMNYTLYQLLSQQSGNVDYCLDEFIGLLLDEVFGKLSEEKEVDHMPKKMKEVKQNKALESIQLVAQQIDVNATLPRLISFIDTYVSTLHVSSTLHNKLTELFQRIYKGLLENKSLPLNKPGELISLVYLIVAEFSQSVAKQLLLAPGVDSTIDSQSHKQRRHDLDKTMSIQLASFGPNSIMHFVHKNKLRTPESLIFNQTTLLAIKLLVTLINGNPQDFVASLQPATERIFSQIVKVVVDCMGSNESDLASNALQLLALLVKQPLRWIKNHKKTLVNNLLEYVAKLTSSDTQIVKDSFALVKSLIESPITELSDFSAAQQKAILAFLHIQVENEKESPMAEPLECLRTIVNKVWPQPSIYDIVVIVKELMIQSNNRKVQNICRQIFVQFLIKYPLSPSVLQSNMDYLLANLNYPYPSGKTQVLNVLQTIMEHFPAATVQQFNEITFLSLIVQYVKEDQEETQQAIESTINVVIGTFALEKKQRQLAMAARWLDDSESKVVVSGLETVRLVGFDQSLLPKLGNIVLVALDDWNQWKLDIAAQHQREENLKTSQWQQEDGNEQVVESQPGNHPTVKSLMKLLINLLKSSPATFFELLSDEKVLCALLRLTAYSVQQTANLAIDLFVDLLKSEKGAYFVEIKQQYLMENLFKILKYQYAVKYQRHPLVQDPQVAVRLAVEFFKVVQKSKLVDLQSEFMNCLSNLTQKYLMAKARLYRHALTDMASTLQQMVHPSTQEVILEIILRMNRLNQILDHPPLYETTSKVVVCIDSKVEQLIQRNVPQAQYIELYSRIQHKLDIARKQRKLENKTMAITNPEEFAQARRMKLKRQKVQRKNRLVELKGMHTLKKKVKV